MKYKRHNREIEIDLNRDEWLPEASKVVLRDKYLLEDEKSPQEAFARASCVFSDDSTHAQRLYDYVSHHWFMFSTPVLSNAGSTRGLPISCFPAGTPIYTINGLKNIEEIQKGDLVLTHKNRYREVEATRKSQSSDIYEFQTYSNTTKIRATGNHLVYTNLGWVRVDELNPNLHFIAQNGGSNLEKETSDLVWRKTVKSVEHTNTGVFPTTTIPEEVVLDEDLAWALGFWFAEGSTSDNGQVRVTHGSQEPCEKWQKIISSKFGLNGRSCKTNKHNWYNGECNSVELQRNFDNIFGKGCKSKTLPDEWMQQSWHPETFEAFFEGFYLGDGFKTTKKPTFELTNVTLCSQIALKLMEQGYDINTQYRKYIHYNKAKSNGVYNGLVSVNPRDGESKRKSSLLMNDGLKYGVLRFVRKVETDEMDVFDLQVREDTSFSVGGIVVHNCFLNYTDDSIGGIADNFTECMWMSVKGGGIGTYWGSVRSIGTPTSSGNKTTGVISFLKNVDSLMLSCHQGSTRRGSSAIYLDISHPEIEEFIVMRKPSGGDYNRKNLNLHHAINISDKFMEAVIRNDDWNLIDPHTRGIKKTVKARDLWKSILIARIETGEPYLHFKDTSNEALPTKLKEKGLKIHGSNLCNEIFLPTSKDRSAVCCLSSVNAEKYDEWKNNELFIEDIMRMLDNVLQYFIDNAPEELHKAVYSATQERSVGLGMMGLHSYFQKVGLPFESPMSLSWSENIVKNIQSKAMMANLKLGEERGEAPDMEGTGQRFAHMMAIAPNASSGIICGTVSPSIEPYNSNAYNQKTSSGDFLIKNKHLREKLKNKYNKDTRHVWDSIISNDGSVQHLSFMDYEDKLLFKTAHEIHPAFIVEHAARRQPFICQGQSVNLFFDANADISIVNKTHIDAWAKGLKGLYYCRSKSIAKAEDVTSKQDVTSEVETEIKQDDVQDECLMCQG